MIWKRLKKFKEEDEKKLQEDIEEEGGLDKKDFFAMTFSALIVILPVATAVLLAIYFLVRLLFRLW